MKRITYKVSLKGLETSSGEISFITLRKILDALYEGSERALRLAIEGESVRTGPVPQWLARSADFVLTGIRKGSTELIFEAPTLGEIAPHQIRQQDLWYTVPQPNDTALTILAKSISDVKKKNLNSERYDAGVLESLLTFQKVMDGRKVNIRLTSSRRNERFTLNKGSFKTIEKIRQKTPEPQNVILTGFFNEIEHSRRKFQLVLEDSQVIRGNVKEGAIPHEQLRAFWGKKVTIKGVLHFLPTKKPRFLEADIIQGRQAGDEVFKTIMLPLPTQEILAEMQSTKIKQGIVSDIWGKWPGEETTEEILDLLKEQEPNS